MRIPAVSLLLGTLGAGLVATRPPCRHNTIGGAAPMPVAVPPAPPSKPATELIRNSKTKVLQGDYDPELTRLPADARAGFGTDLARVNALLSLLVTKTLAAQARAAGLDKPRDAAAHRHRDRARLRWCYRSASRSSGRRNSTHAPASKPRASAGWPMPTSTGRRSRSSHAHPVRAVEAHEGRGAEARAGRARQGAGRCGHERAGEGNLRGSVGAANDGRIEALARPGRPRVRARRVRAANPGDLSEPVLSRYGYHVIRLDGRRRARWCRSPTSRTRSSRTCGRSTSNSGAPSVSRPSAPIRRSS